MRSSTGGLTRTTLGIAALLGLSACGDDTHPANAGGAEGTASEVSSTGGTDGVGHDDGAVDGTSDAASDGGSAPGDGSGANDTGTETSGCSDGACGTCPSDCFGAPCIDGLCQPVAIQDWTAYGFRYSREFGWAGDAAILRAGLCPLDGPWGTFSGWELRQVAVDGSTAAFAAPADGSIASPPFDGDDAFIYYQGYAQATGGHALVRRDRVTGEDVILHDAGEFAIVSFARTDSDFYALLVDIYDTRLVRIAADGSETETLLAAQYVTTNSGIFQPSVILHGDAIAFWWNYVSPGVNSEQVAYPADIWTMPRTGGEPTVLVSGVSQITALASDGERVYYTANGTYNTHHVPEHDGGVYAVGASGEVETIASQLVGLGEVAVDDTHVYWTAANVLYRRAKQGGAPEVLPVYPAGRGVVLTDDAVVTTIRHDHTACDLEYTAFADFFEATLVRLGK